MSEAIDRHIDHVRALTRRGAPLDPRGETASIHNPAWFLPDGTTTAARRRLHATIRAEILAATDRDTEPIRHAMILAGPPGAGKSTLRRGPLREEIAGHVLIDPDDIKTRLLQEARSDGSLEAFLIPRAVRDLEAAGEQFFPLEFSALVHIEATQIARRARADAIRASLPMVIDGVLSQPAEAIALGRGFEAAEYTIDVVVADLPFEVSEHQIRRRWREAYERTLAGETDLMGGRWVPSDYRPVSAGLIGSWWVGWPARAERTLSRRDIARGSAWRAATALPWGVGAGWGSARWRSMAAAPAVRLLVELGRGGGSGVEPYPTGASATFEVGRGVHLGPGSVVRWDGEGGGGPLFMRDRRCAVCAGGTRETPLLCEDRPSRRPGWSARARLGSSPVTGVPSGLTGALLP